jgi:hypothetical protein
MLTDAQRTSNPRFYKQLQVHTSDDDLPTLSTRRMPPYQDAVWKRSVAQIIVGCGCLLAISIMAYSYHNLPIQKMDKSLTITFPASDTTLLKYKFSIPSEPLNIQHTTKSLDYGGLEIEMLKHPFQRTIHINEFARLERFRSHIFRQGTNETSERNIPTSYWYYEDLESMHHMSCRPPAWSKLHFPNCNAFHEMNLEETDREKTNNYINEIYIINHGFYRDVWVNRFLLDGTASVLKTTKYHLDFSWRNMRDVHREALIMEQLTMYENIVTPYGHCGTSVITEAVPYQVEPYIVPGTGYAKRQQLLRDRQDDVHSKNELSAQEKLKTALEMAESIAVLHGFHHGVIVHNDIQLQQWLRTYNDTLKLGDFNRAMILQWNMKEKRYCKYSSGTAFGNVRLNGGL